MTNTELRKELKFSGNENKTKKTSRTPAWGNLKDFEAKLRKRLADPNDE